jgi:hypothetical protein
LEGEAVVVTALQLAQGALLMFTVKPLASVEAHELLLLAETL